jgi:transcription elongation factor Elf1
MFNFFKSPSTPQTTFINCRQCNNELCSSDSFISDTYDDNNDNHVLYKCSNCGLDADYNFDIAPVPINWLDLNGKTNE